MQDIRINKLAESLVHYSCKVNKNENVLIKVYGEGEEYNLVVALIKEIYKAGVHGGKVMAQGTAEEIKKNVN